MFSSVEKLYFENNSLILIINHKSYLLLNHMLCLGILNVIVEIQSSLTSSANSKRLVCFDNFFFCSPELNIGLLGPWSRGTQYGFAR